MEHSNSNQAIALLRVSSGKQGLIGDSPEQQLEICSHKATKHGRVIVKDFPHIESGAVPLDDQPSWAAVRYCEKHPEIRYCYVKDMERFTRSGAEAFLAIWNALLSLNVELIDTEGFVDDKIENTLEHLDVSYPWSIVRPSRRRAIDKSEEARENREKILKLLLGAEIMYVRKGYKAGEAQFGYKNEKIETAEHGVRTIMTPFEKEAFFIRRMFELITEGKSDQEVCDVLNALGFKTRNFKKRDKHTRKVIGIGGGKPLYSKQLWRYISNPIYCGVYRHRMLRTENKETGKETLQPIFFEGEPILSVEAWNKANKGKCSIDVVEGKITIYKGKIPERYTKKTKENEAWPYKLYLRCHVCGRQIKASAPGGKLKHVPIYHCAGTRNEPHQYYGQNAGVLHKEIEEMIHHLKFSDEFIEKLRNTLLRKHELRRERAHQDTVDVAKQVQLIQDEQTLILEKIKQTSSSLVLKALEEDYEKLDKKKIDAQSHRNKAENQEVNIQTVIEYFRYWMEHLEELLIDKDNPLVSARLFSLCFDVAPTIPTILNGTPTLSPLFRLDEEYKKQKLSQKEVSETVCDPMGNRTPITRMKT
ncbi:MAG: hypothetical protein COY81_02955 [Candidatus Pacebacteria bacterium CG_4_10_14_0_8_um_filter_43_12]|nr:MAG: hypothetical protein COY81_02955 [Candidatus Pacebacteria bacterium CG_4_10_14_0_8_um_filter_43_12]